MVSCQLDDQPKLVGFAGVEPASPPRSESRARTCDTLINSQLLYRLSYLGMALLPTCRLHERRCSLVGTPYRIRTGAFLGENQAS